MCIYYSHWINLPDIFSSIKQNTQMPPLLLFSNCFISKRGTGSWRRDTFALCRSPCQPLWAEKREKAGACLSKMGLRLGEGQERSLSLKAELLGFPELEGNGELDAARPKALRANPHFPCACCEWHAASLWKLWPCDVGCTHLARNNRSPHILKSHYQPERPCCINYSLTPNSRTRGSCFPKEESESGKGESVYTDSAGGFQSQSPSNLGLPPDCCAFQKPW